MRQLLRLTRHRRLRLTHANWGCNKDRSFMGTSPLSARSVDLIVEKGHRMSSTGDKIKGKSNELAGKARKAAGDALDDPEMKGKGAAQEAKGNLQQAKGDAKSAVKKAVDRT